MYLFLYFFQLSSKKLQKREGTSESEETEESPKSPEINLEETSETEATPKSPENPISSFGNKNRSGFETEHLAADRSSPEPEKSLPAEDPKVRTQ